MQDVISQFRQALQARSIIPGEILADGRLHRCEIEGRNGRSKDGVYVLHLDGIPAGGFMNWADGRGWEDWRAEAERKFSPAEEAAHRAKVEAMRREREAEDARRKDEARERAAAIWKTAKPAQDDHPYLARKGIKAHGLRLHKGLLVVPMRDGAGEIHSLQFIAPDGEKRFLTGGRVSGCHYVVGKPDGVLCIAEGYATAASIHQATGHAVAVAFNAGNLEPVARALRGKYPEVRLVMCADDDYRTEGNPGVTRAMEAARAVGGLLAVPDFGDFRPDGATDFNDLYLAAGPEVVKACIEQAKPPEAGQKATKKPTGEQPRISQATRLVQLSEELNVKLFHDQTKAPYALMSHNGNSVAWATSNRNFARWLAERYFERFGSTPGTDAIRQALNVLEGRACFREVQIELFNRVAWHGSALFYDLSNTAGQAVKVTADGWEVVNDPPVVFRRYEHQEPQVIPAPRGNIRLLVPYLNLRDETMVPLELSYLVSCYIPAIPHPVHVSYGPQGSAKSTQDRLKRRLIDPSANDVQTLAADDKQTVQVLARNWFSSFDNVSRLSAETSDLLCRASTGASYSKRALYTNDDDVIQYLQCCVSLNGINVAVNKADLMDRSLLIEYARIPQDQRREAKEVLAAFEKVRPAILGGIFDVLSRAIRIKPEIRPGKIPRMADFAIWAAAISEAMGYGATTFLNLYEENISQQNHEIICSNPVGLALMRFMENRLVWSGSISLLLTELETVRKELGISDRDKMWPRAPHILTRRIRELETTFNALGVQIYGDRTGRERRITIEKYDATEKVASPVASSGEPHKHEAIDASDASDGTFFSVREEEKEGYGGPERGADGTPIHREVASVASLASSSPKPSPETCDGCPYLNLMATWSPEDALCQRATRFLRDLEKCPLKGSNSGTIEAQ